jgi:hypothetical protein
MFAGHPIQWQWLASLLKFALALCRSSTSNKLHTMCPAVRALRAACIQT